jgi:hypothetical protein
VNQAKYIGMDVHQATISVAVMDSAGKLILESILETKAATILQFVGGLRGSLLVTFEEGTSSQLARIRFQSACETPLPQRKSNPETDLHRKRSRLLPHLPRS